MLASRALNLSAIPDRSNKLSKCQEIIKYNYNDENLLWEALQQPGALGGMFLPEGNKTMAHLGDAVVLLYIRREAWKRGILKSKHRPPLPLSVVCTASAD